MTNKTTLSDYDQHRLNQTKTVLNCLNTLGAYKWEIVQFGDYGGDFYICLIEDHRIRVGYHDYLKQYGFYLDHKLKYISFDDMRKYETNNQAPKKVGVLTANKVRDWVSYLKAEAVELEKISKEKIEKVEAMLKEIEAIAKLEGSIATGGKRLNTWGDEDISGSVRRGGIEMSYTVDSRNGWINREIRASYYPLETSLETFKKMSDNQLIKEAK